mmetsp:Transcript_19208/g.44855  ORF Transcript_19208/g.44855 Transcript_19208/m.44855 type:complete len:222 (+) Transcript_19208:1082-1747(+)
MISSASAPSRGLPTFSRRYTSTAIARCACSSSDFVTPGGYIGTGLGRVGASSSLAFFARRFALLAARARSASPPSLGKARTMVREALAGAVKGLTPDAFKSPLLRESACSLSEDLWEGAGAFKSFAAAFGALGDFAKAGVREGRPDLETLPMEGAFLRSEPERERVGTLKVCSKVCSSSPSSPSSIASSSSPLSSSSDLSSACPAGVASAMAADISALPMA